MGEDPIGFESRDFNFYRYAANSPINFIDPGGEIAPIAIIIVSAGIRVVAIGVKYYTSYKKAMRQLRKQCSKVRRAYKTAQAIGCKGFTCEQLKYQVRMKEIEVNGRKLYLTMGCERVEKVPARTRHQRHLSQALTARDKCIKKKEKACECSN
ncbi:MAG TPA: hypothetical protein ENK75_01520 [Saprospiraceae bacterium]|nr:hypothetical protein [Saprospiraceae bacterium]